MWLGFEPGRPRKSLSNSLNACSKKTDCLPRFWPDFKLGRLRATLCSRMLAHNPTELVRTKQQLGLDSPFYDERAFSPLDATAGIGDINLDNSENTW